MTDIAGNEFLHRIVCAYRHCTPRIFFSFPKIIAQNLLCVAIYYLRQATAAFRSRHENPPVPARVALRQMHRVLTRLLRTRYAGISGRGAAAISSRVVVPKSFGCLVKGAGGFRRNRRGRLGRAGWGIGIRPVHCHSFRKERVERYRKRRHACTCRVLSFLVAPPLQRHS